MDNESYEQEPIDSHKLGDSFKFVKENMECKVLSYKWPFFLFYPIACIFSRLLGNFSRKSPSSRLP